TAWSSTAAHAWAEAASRATATIASRWRSRWRRRWPAAMYASTTSPTWRRRSRGSTSWLAGLGSGLRSRLPPLLQAELDRDSDSGGNGLAVAGRGLEAPVAGGDQGGAVEGAVAGTVGIVHVDRPAVGVDVDAQGHAALHAAAPFFGRVTRQCGAQQLRLAGAWRAGGDGALGWFRRPGAFLRGLGVGGAGFIRRAFDDREFFSADRRRAVAGGDVPPAEGTHDQQQDPERRRGAGARGVFFGQGGVVVGAGC